MKKIENHCVDCGLPCWGNSCPHRNVEVFYCDKCKDETTLYYFEGRELCIHCIEESLEVVEGSEV
jgi:hypothetical protein